MISENGSHGCLLGPGLRCTRSHSAFAMSGKGHCLPLEFLFQKCTTHQGECNPHEAASYQAAANREHDQLSNHLIRAQNSRNNQVRMRRGKIIKVMTYCFIPVREFQRKKANAAAIKVSFEAQMASHTMSAVLNKH